MYGVIVAVYYIVKNVNITLCSMFHHVSKQFVFESLNYSFCIICFGLCSKRRNGGCFDPINI